MIPPIYAAIVVLHVQVLSCSTMTHVDDRDFDAITIYALKVCSYGCNIVWLLMMYVHVKEMVPNDSRQSLSNTCGAIAEFNGGVHINVDILECTFL